MSEILVRNRTVLEPLGAGVQEKREREGPEAEKKRRHDQKECRQTFSVVGSRASSDFHAEVFEVLEERMFY